MLLVLCTAGGVNSGWPELQSRRPIQNRWGPTRVWTFGLLQPVQTIPVHPQGRLDASSARLQATFYRRCHSSRVFALTAVRDSVLAMRAYLGFRTSIANYGCKHRSLDHLGHSRRGCGVYGVASADGRNNNFRFGPAGAQAQMTSYELSLGWIGLEFDSGWHVPREDCDSQQVNSGLHPNWNIFPAAK